MYVDASCNFLFFGAGEYIVSLSDPPESTYCLYRRGKSDRHTMYSSTLLQYIVYCTNERKGYVAHAEKQFSHSLQRNNFDGP